MSDDMLLKELARVKAHFQLRAICTVLDIPIRSPAQRVAADVTDGTSSPLLRDTQVLAEGSHILRQHAQQPRPNDGQQVAHLKIVSSHAEGF